MTTTTIRTVSAAEANRGFSRLLREVRQGASFVVTSHGAPVARLAPFAPEADRRAASRRSLLQRLVRETPIDVGPWSRDELHDF